MIFLEDGPKHPAVPVKVGELGRPQGRIEIGDVREEFRIGPVAPRGGFVGIAHRNPGQFLSRMLATFRGIHQLPFGFLIPPHVPEVTVHHRGAGVDMADDALARRDRGGEAMGDGMTRFVRRDHWIGIGGEAVGFCGRDAPVSVLGVRSGMNGRAVVGIDDVACRTAARAVVAGLIVGPEEIERRVQQTRLLQADEHRVGTVSRPQAAHAEPRAGTAGFVPFLGDSNLGDKPPAPFEDAQNVGRLRDLVPRQRVQKWQHAFRRRLFGGRWWNGLQTLRHAMHAVALTVLRPFIGRGPVVVERRTPQHAAVGHHALSNLQCFLLMATAAGDVRDPQVARVHESNELGPLVVEQRVRPNRVGGTGPGVGKCG